MMFRMHHGAMKPWSAAGMKKGDTLPEKGGRIAFFVVRGSFCTTSAYGSPILKREMVCISLLPTS